MFDREDELENGIELDNVKQSTCVDIDSWVKCVSGITILHLNIRSLNSNWDELKVALKNQLGKINVLILSEVSLQITETLLAYYSLDGYNLHYNVRTHGRGGGLFMYVMNDIRVDTRKSNFRLFEAIDCTLTLSDRRTKIDILAIYRPPDLSKCNFVLELESYLENSKTDNCVVIGDVNLNLLDEEDNTVQNYENALSAHGFIKCIKGATREEFSGGILHSSCIDHVYLRSNINKILSAIITTKISDHYLIGLHICSQFTDPMRGNKSSELFQRLNERVLKRSLQACDWNSLLLINSSEELYDAIVKLFTDCYELARCNSSTRDKYKRDQKIWITEGLRTKIRDRDCLYKRWKNCNNILKETHRATYIKYRNSVRKMIRKAKFNFFKREFEKTIGDIKSSWQKINLILGKKKKKSVDEVISSYLGTKFSDKDIASKFAESFIDEVIKLKHECSIKTFTQLPSAAALQSMYLPKITSKEVSDIIASTNSLKQPGWDDIRVSDIKNIDAKISPVISKLINLTILEGTIPDRMKLSVVRPIYKKDDHFSFNNYRPIAMLSSIEKIMERYISTKLTEYLSKFNLINAQQYGFQRGKSTTDLLVHFSDYINLNLNDNKHCIVLFIDFSKAFDTLDSSKLIFSLQNVGVRGPVLKWFANYLYQRQILVKVNTRCSNHKTVKSGVPQGSILGPILYLVYVNELFNSVNKCRIFMYADDTILVSAHRNIKKSEEMLQTDFNNLLRWTHDHDLICNPKKTKTMHICSPFNIDKNYPLHIVPHTNNCLHSRVSSPHCSCSVAIESVDCYLYLGVKIDRHFTWKNQTEQLCRRLRSVAFCLYKLKSSGCPLGLLRTVYMALGESLISYGLLAWGSASDDKIKKVSRIQNKLIKIIFDYQKKRKENYNDMYQQLNLLPIDSLFQYKLITKFYFDDTHKIVHQNQLMKARLRITERFVIPKYINKHGKRQLQYKIPKLFNKIPHYLSNLNSYNKVKSHIKSWLLHML
jgi:hypothetical protein